MRIATILMLVGAGVFLVGLVLRFAPWAVSWFGRLPGDIRHEGETTRVFIPITSMILLSVVLTVLVNVIARFFRGD